MQFKRIVLAAGLSCALTTSLGVLANSCAVGGYDTSSSSAFGSWGGVSLNKTANLLLELEDVDGAILDEATGQIVFYGKQRILLPKMDLDDLSVAVRSIYGHGGQTPQDPGVSIGTEPSNIPGQMKVRYDGQTRQTKFGQIMFDADRLLKTLSTGKDNITGQPVSSQVPGYRNMLDRYWDRMTKFGDTTSSWHSRMWFVPEEISLKRTADGGAMEFDRVSMKLLNESTFLNTSTVINDPASTQFSQHFTTNYDLFANEFEVLKELKRLSKITAIIKWIKTNDLPMDISFVDDYQPLFVNTPDYTPSTTVVKSKNYGAGIVLSVQVTGGVNLNLNDTNYNEFTSATAAEFRNAAINARPDEKQFSWTFQKGGQQYQAIAQSMARSRKDGNISWLATDLSFPVAGKHTLSLNRYYSSFNEKSSGLGRGWVVTPLGLRFSDGKLNYSFTYPNQTAVTVETHYRIFVRSGNSELPYTLAGITNTGHPVYTAPETEIQLTYDPVQQSYSLIHRNSTHADFNRFGKLTTVTDTNQISMNYIYNTDQANAHLITIQHQNGRKIDLIYQGDHLIQATGPGASSVSYSYNLQNQLSQINSACCHNVSLSYDTENRLSRIIDGRGTTIFSASYDAYNRANVQRYGALATAGNQFDLNNRKGVTTNAKGVVSTRYYDTDYRLLTSVDSEGRQVDLTWQTKFGPASVTDPMKAKTQYQYNSSGNISSITDAQLNVRSFLYDNASNLSYAEDSLGIGVYNQYDSFNRLVTRYDVASRDPVTGVVSTAADFITNYQYDPQGNIINVKQGPATDERTQTASYDVNGMPTSTTDSAGITVHFVYDNRSRLIRKYDAVGDLVSYTYDNADQVTQITTPAGTVHYSYDENGNLISQTDARNYVTHYAYNADNQLARVTDAEGGITDYSYDIHGNITQILLPNGMLKTINYDKLDRPTAELLQLAKDTPKAYLMIARR